MPVNLKATQTFTGPDTAGWPKGYIKKGALFSVSAERAKALKEDGFAVDAKASELKGAEVEAEPTAVTKAAK